jgi:hypothetical protein
MKSRYDGAPGKDAVIANVRQKRFEAEHSGKDSFVKKQQAMLAKMGGKSPDMMPELMEFNANMANNGAHAQRLAVSLTKGLDKVAYPVDGEGNDA